MDREKPLTDESLIRETDKFWDDPKNIMNLIDLLFLWDDPDRGKVCS